jgi:hypothetical protein
VVIIYTIIALMGTILGKPGNFRFSIFDFRLRERREVGNFGFLIFDFRLREGGGEGDRRGRGGDFFTEGSKEVQPRLRRTRAKCSG